MAGTGNLVEMSPDEAHGCALRFTKGIGKKIRKDGLTYEIKENPTSGDQAALVLWPQTETELEVLGSDVPTAYKITK